MKDLEDIIKQAILKKAKKLQEDRSKTIHVTDLTGCIRKSYYIKKHGFPFSEKVAFWLLFGSLVHESLSPVIARRINGETEVRTKYKYKGVEILATADVLGDNEVIELKTCKNLPYSPFHSHVEQINAYMHMFGKPRGVIVYISRTQLGVRVFEQLGDWDLFKRTLDKAVLLKTALDKDVPPPCNLPLHLRKVYCKDCPFRVRCTQDSELL